MSGVYGRKIKMTIFGESHGASIGLVIDGLPPGLGIDIDFIKREMERRAPGRNLLSTQRQEKDAFLIQTIVISRLIDGEYFRIDQMLSSDYETKVTINKKEFLDCIERATILIRENDKKPLILNVGDNTMELKLNSSFGSMNAELMIHKTGKDIMIGFNPKFLIDALRVIDDEEINIYMMNPKSPCFIKDEDATYIYLILPVNFNAAAV